jgi:two-component system OmpR family response regulator
MVGQPEAPTLYADKFLMICYLRRMVWVAGVQVHLTNLEYRVLECLTRHAGEAMSQEAIWANVWACPLPGVDLIKRHISKLRKKLGFPNAGPIQTERGYGYRYGPEFGKEES